MVTAAIKAIETRWRGYRFRSRLEARWAVFFDALGLPWEYEKEGYNLGALGPYLPDFWLPTLHDRERQAGMWIEVKGAEPTRLEERKLEALCEHTRRSGVLVYGPPSGTWPELDRVNWQQWTVSRVCVVDDGFPEVYADERMVFHVCRQCKAVKVDYDSNYHTCPGCGEETCSQFDPMVKAAADLARAARFEHGETPR